MTSKNYSSKRKETIKNKKFKGGSVSSDLVSQLSSPGNCEPELSNHNNLLSKENIISNYGSSSRLLVEEREKILRGVQLLQN